MADESPKANGIDVKTVGEQGDKEEGKYYGSQERMPRPSPRSIQEEITLYTIFNRLITTLFFPNDTLPLLLRVRCFLLENGPLLQLAVKNSARHLIFWTRRGSPFRALLVVSVGTIALFALTGLLVFMLFFVAVTINAIVISLLMSLAVAGGFLAMFFFCVMAVYIGALTVAIFVISMTTITAIISALIATGWIGFFWILWLGTKKGVGMAKRSLSTTGLVVSAYSFGMSARQHHESDNSSNR